MDARYSFQLSTRNFQLRFNLQQRHRVDIQDGRRAELRFDDGAPVVGMHMAVQHITRAHPRQKAAQRLEPSGLLKNIWKPDFLIKS